MFKTLASLFRAQKTSSEAEDSVEEVVTDKVIESPEEGPTEETETPEEEASPEAGLPTQPQISTDRYNGLLALEAEITQFGATPAARANFLKEAKTLHDWYENVKLVGITGHTEDASAVTKTKGKKVSATTAEAIALQERLAKK